MQKTKCAAGSVGPETWKEKRCCFGIILSSCNSNSTSTKQRFFSRNFDAQFVEAFLMQLMVLELNNSRPPDAPPHHLLSSVFKVFQIYRLLCLLLTSTFFASRTLTPFHLQSISSFLPMQTLSVSSTFFGCVQFLSVLLK